jgi:26S proteasome regulatory subunit N6
MAEKVILLTKKLQEAQTSEENNQIGDAIRLYEEIVNYPL